MRSLTKSLSSLDGQLDGKAVTASRSVKTPKF